MTGQIITEGVSTFTPILTRLLDIVKELIPYAIYITIGALGVSLLWNAVKYILGHLKKETTRTFDNETIQDIKENRQEDITEGRDMETIVNNYNELYDDFEPGELSGLGHSKMRIYNGMVQQQDAFGDREDAAEYNENNTHGRKYLTDRYKELTRYYNDRF